MKRYLVKCDECRATMRRTDDVRESYQGDTCEPCRERIARQCAATTAKIEARDAG